jgi:hypothetical protein
VLSVEDWSEILGLHRAEQMPIKVIARTLGMAGNRVRACESRGVVGFGARHVVRT